MVKKVSLKIFAEIHSFSELPDEERDLVNHSCEILKDAYAPYSKFKVGAAVLLVNKKIIRGSNQENAAYPSGLCAERVAVFGAGANYPNVPVKAIAIAAKMDNGIDYVNAFSCGSCRQALMEYQSRQRNPINLIFVGPKKEVLKTTVSDLLPFSFDSNALQGL